MLMRVRIGGALASRLNGARETRRLAGGASGDAVPVLREVGVLEEDDVVVGAGGGDRVPDGLERLFLVSASRWISKTPTSSGSVTSASPSAAASSSRASRSRGLPPWRRYISTIWVMPLYGGPCREAGAAALAGGDVADLGVRPGAAQTVQRYGGAASERSSLVLGWTTRPRVAAQWLTSWREVSCSLRRTSPTWDSTVRSLMPEPHGDPLVRVAAGEVVQDLALARRQRLELRGGGPARRAEGLQHERGQARAEARLAGGDGRDRRQQLGGVDRLGHVAQRARADHRHDVLGGVGDREREHPRRASARQRLQHRHAAAVGQVHVEQHDVGLRRGDHRQRLGGRGRLAHDVVMGGELGAHARAEEMVIVDDDDPQPAHDAPSTTPMRSAISVPSPGRDSTAAVPPAAAIRPMIESRTPRRSVGTSRVEAGPSSRTKTSAPSGPAWAKTKTGAPGACRAALRSASRAAAASASDWRSSAPVAEDRQLDHRVVVVLDLGHGLAQRGAERLGAELDLARHPRAQLVLLAARQPRDGGGIVRLALDERERLQDGVVQVRGDAPALVLARVVDARRSDARQARDQQRDPDERRRPRRSTSSSTSELATAAQPGVEQPEREDRREPDQREPAERAPRPGGGRVSGPGQPLPGRHARRRARRRRARRSSARSTRPPVAASAMTASGTSANSEARQSPGRAARGAQAEDDARKTRQARPKQREHRADQQRRMAASRREARGTSTNSASTVPAPASASGAAPRSGSRSASARPASSSRPATR